MSERQEVLLERGYVLHQRPYRNTSLLVDCLTARHGRQTLVAQGARRPGSRQAAALQPFRPALFSWISRGELGRLTYVEAVAGGRALAGDMLIAAFYLNELLLRLVPSGDQSDAILSCYSSCLDRLAETCDATRPLRLFELELLEALGYRVDLEQDFRTGEPIAPDCDYVFEHENGLTASNAGTTMEVFSGRHLISLREHRLDDSGSLGTARRLLGGILSFHLGGRPLKTRRVMREIVDRKLTR
ncbi:MAG TPA: DNA repair protein RecO [Gammaproteobacteria bacterium]|nr:DNA repair protein RecO [Gammaproteobacteria bacterium]